MESSPEAEHLAKLRRAIFMTMAAVQFVDLSASSKTYAQSTITHLAFKMCQQQFSDELIREAAQRVIVCLGHEVE